jgi:predicted phage terminase large subunit-like protein
MPSDVVAWWRSWDLAATEPSDDNKDPDWTCGVLMGKRKSGRLLIADAIFARKRSDEVRSLIRRTAENDGVKVKIRIPKDPAQAGVDQANSYLKLLEGFSVSAERETGDKETRVDPFASQWQGGNVDVLRGTWNAQYFGQMEGFPSKKIHDDAVDATGGAFRKLTSARPSWSDVL